MAFVEVAELETLPQAEAQVFQAGGRELVLVRWQDDVFALRNICPHMSTSLFKGTVMACRTGTVGEPGIDRENPVLTCPWHQYEYTLADGRCLTDQSLRVRSYPVQIEDGKVLVDLEGHRGRTPAETAEAAAR